MYTENRRGPRTEPRGTPQPNRAVEEAKFPRATEKVLLASQTLDGKNTRVRLDLGPDVLHLIYKMVKKLYNNNNNNNNNNDTILCI